MGSKIAEIQLTRKTQWIFFTYLDGRYSTHEQQHHLYKIFGNSKRIIMYLGGGTESAKIGAKIDKDIEMRQFPTGLS